MSRLEGLQPERVFKYFEEISTVPRGSGNMEAIADYCIEFANRHSLEAYRDTANNVIIYKGASKGYESHGAVILQGHLDIVCQKMDDREIDFLKEGLDIYFEGDFVKAKGTTLGADNGIAVAMILAILESDSIAHPPIEAVFTTDEEVGMLGAVQIDMSRLSAKRMINLDAEEDDTLTVSCAGGTDFKITVKKQTVKFNGREITVTLNGLKGGHSGVEINSGRINADMLAGEFLNHMSINADFEIVSINGGDKSNAIPNSCVIRLCSVDAEGFRQKALDTLSSIKAEIKSREPEFSFDIALGQNGEYEVLESSLKEKLIFFLTCAPNGIMQMSADIEGLVETSLNLGILKTEEEEIVICFALRSNKDTSLSFLEEKLARFSSCIPCETKTSGHYPPWEFNGNSKLQEIYKECFVKRFNKEPKIEAIHAGLECGVFSAAIEGADCIAMGPMLYDVHTVNERLSISSTEQIYKLLLEILEKC